jgi:hypothetical protein
MTSTPDTQTTDSPAVSTSKRMRRTLTGVLVGICAILGVPGTAFAYTDPAGGGSTSVPIAGPDSNQAPVAHASSSGWGLTTTLLVVVIIGVLAIGIVMAAQQVARHRRNTNLTAAGA